MTEQDLIPSDTSGSQSEKVECPGCHQSWVLKVRVRQTGDIVYLCDDCETLWLSPESIGEFYPTNYTFYMHERGLPGLWDQIEVLGYAVVHA